MCKTPKNLYLETNAINKALENNISGETLKKILNNLNYIPFISIETTYEIARTMQNTNNKDKVKKLFKIIRDLNPLYLCDTDFLITQEIKHLREGISVQFLLNEKIEEQLLQTINSIIEDSDVDISFIDRLESDIKKYQENLKEDLKEKSAKKNFANFEAYKINKMNDRINFKKFFEKITNTSLKDDELDTLLQNFSSYPALRITCNANLYLNYLIYKDGAAPSKDKTDDFRHLIDASYCSVLVTDDVKLKKYAADINPDIRVIEFSEILSS